MTVAPFDAQRGPELRQLRYFRVLADELHFGRAAARLGIAQPPLSVQIQRLEGRVGARLLERSRAGVSLTAAGVALRDELDELLPRLDGMLERVRAAARGEQGALRIGFVSPAEFSFLPAFIREFRAAVPGLRLSLHELTSDAQIEALAAGRLDAGFVLPPVAGGLDYRPVARDALEIVLPAGHRLARGRGPLAVATLAELPLIVFPREKAPGLYDEILGLFARAGVTPTIGQQAIQMQTIVSLVAAGLGMAVVPQAMRRLGRRGVVHRRPDVAPPAFEIGIAWRASTGTPALARFVAAALAIAPASRRAVGE